MSICIRKMCIRDSNKLVILVPVANQIGIRIVHMGHGGYQLRLGTGLQTVITVSYTHLGQFLGGSPITLGGFGLNG